MKLGRFPRQQNQAMSVDDADQHLPGVHERFMELESQIVAKVNILPMTGHSSLQHSWPNLMDSRVLYSIIPVGIQAYKISPSDYL